MNKLNIPKIYYLSYNAVRANENKLNFAPKKVKGKYLYLPMINTNNGLINYNFNYNRMNIQSLSKGINSVNNNNEQNNKNGNNNLSKKNSFKNKITDKNKILFGFISPGKERYNNHHFKIIK